MDKNTQSSLKKSNIDWVRLKQNWSNEFVCLNGNRVFFYKKNNRFVLFDADSGYYEEIKYRNNNELCLLRDFSFDHVRNNICLLVGEYVNDAGVYKEERYHFCLFNVDDFSWQVIPELTNKVEIYHYDFEKNVVYFMSDSSTGKIFLFDMEERVILSEQTIPNFSRKKVIYSFSGNPLEVLFAYKKEDSEGSGSESYDYGIYNYDSQSITDSSNLNVPELNVWYCDSFVYLSAKKYLCIDRNDRKNRRIVMIDFEGEEKVTIVHDWFASEFRNIWNLRRMAGNKYSFLAMAKNWKKYLCSFSIPSERASVR